MSIRGEAQSIDDAVCIAAIETVLKPLGTSLKHYMPGPKADAIEAMRGVLMAERDRAAAPILALRYTADQGIDAEMASYNSGLDDAAALIRKGGQ